MPRGLKPHFRFAAVALAAVIATLVIASAALGGEAAAAPITTAAGARTQQLDGAHAQALKLHYLRCEQAASDGTLDRAGVMSCSVVYEELKHRVFGGSFDALHAWWREMRDRARPEAGGARGLHATD